MRGQAQPIDLLGLVPDLERVPGFKSSLRSQRSSRVDGTIHATVSAGRASDGLSIRIWVMVTPTPAKAEAEALHWVRTPAGDMKPGSPSGASFGQKSWYSRYEPGKTPQGSLTLLVLDGRTLTRVDLSARRDAGVAHPFSASDRELAETLASEIVTKLKQKGYAQISEQLP